MSRWLCAPLVAMLLAASQARGQSDAYRAGLHVDVSNTDSATVLRFVDTLKAVVARNDRRAAARLMDYPLEVWDGAKYRHVRSERSFLARYDAFLPRALQRTIASLTIDSLFSNWQGIMFDNGRVWFHAVPSGALKIATINAPVDTLLAPTRARKPQ